MVWMVMGRLGDQRVCKLGGDLAATRKGKSLSLAAAGLPCNSHPAPQRRWPVHTCSTDKLQHLFACWACWARWACWPAGPGASWFPATCSSAAPAQHQAVLCMPSHARKKGFVLDRIRVEKQQRPAVMHRCTTSPPTDTGTYPTSMLLLVLGYAACYHDPVCYLVCTIVRAWVA